MNEIEELEYDKLMLRSAMENTYLILTGRATWDTLLDKASMQPGSDDQHNDLALLFNPMAEDYNPKFPHLHNDVNSDELIESMLEYYIETEEYEKCAELVNYKEIKYGTTRKTKK
tara:strand:- start:2280 stop:2624 length:345 start_codon:yes stop_codon:yes gene_type:complete